MVGSFGFLRFFMAQLLCSGSSRFRTVDGNGIAPGQNLTGSDRQATVIFEELLSCRGRQTDFEFYASLTSVAGARAVHSAHAWLFGQKEKTVPCATRL